MDYKTLREKFPVFIYHGFELGNKELTFHFQLGEHEFRPRWEFPFELEKLDFNRKTAENIAFSLGMAELVSYWKCACPKRVEIRCGKLSEKQAEWWKKLYWNGLGEFFYRNGIEETFGDFMEIISEGAAFESAEEKRRLSGALVPVGGGKDSAVTLELLKKAGADITPYSINSRKAVTGCIEAAGIEENKYVCFKRTIDAELLKLNKQGFLNGHTPFSAVVAFSGELCACFLGKKYVVLSNESSANESYVEGKNVNHQYSKSTEFERDFREYCAEYFGECAEYFSLLRPLSEWQIAREFVKYPQYRAVFQSCNLGSKNDVWCCKCAKCLYTYVLLAAFLDDRELADIFGENLLENEALGEMLDGLMLDGEDKPFECVGTKSEVRLALSMAAKRREGALPPLLRRFRERFGGYAPAELGGYFDEENFVPDEFIPYVKRACEK